MAGALRKNNKKISQLTVSTNLADIKNSWVPVALYNEESGTYTNVSVNLGQFADAIEHGTIDSEAIYAYINEKVQEMQNDLDDAKSEWSTELKDVNDAIDTLSNNWTTRIDGIEQKVDAAYDMAYIAYTSMNNDKYAYNAIVNMASPDSYIYSPIYEGASRLFVEKHEIVIQDLDV